MKVTPKRLAWLRRLAENGRSHRDGTVVGCHCMRAGWTEWRYRTPEREYISNFEAAARYGDRWWNHVYLDGEVITDAGRAVLEEWSE